MEGRRAREGGLEMRKLHIVYFLSRNGKIEQPHLIRVHHLNRNGIHLRDAKRWLSELRGREMPHCFSWSYKRRYKAGYIWQDLTDDDLIPPISDNEYILKGSLLPPLNKTKTVEDFLTKKQPLEKEEAAANMLWAETLHIDDSISPKPPPHADEEPPAAPAASSPSSEDCTRQAVAFRADDSRQEEMKRGEQQRSNEIVIRKRGSRVHRSSSKAGGETGRRLRVPEVLRNLFRCRTVDTKDSALRSACPKDGSMMPGSNRRRSSSSNDRKSWERRGGQGSTKLRERSASAMYKPVAEPNCSQCGKPFRPEKLHSHMKSCRALREKGRSRSFNRE